MTRIEEINWLKASAPACWIRYSIERKLQEHDTQAAEIASLRQQVERLRAALEHIGNRSASPWVQKDCESALAADGEQNA